MNIQQKIFCLTIFSRKYMLVKYSKACVVFLVDLVLLDELFEVLTLTQTGKMNGFKIYFLELIIGNI